jgi:hypothetical protein
MRWPKETVYLLPFVMGGVFIATILGFAGIVAILGLVGNTLVWLIDGYWPMLGQCS